jgi:hypothetical protein
MLSDKDVVDVFALIKATRENLDRIEAKLKPAAKPVDDLDTGSPLNKDGVNLTPRGVEVCYRLFDQGKTRYAVSQALDISYGAATHRFHAWEKLGGKDRERQPLDR